MKMATIRIRGSSKEYDTKVNVTAQQVITAMANYDAMYPNNDFHDDTHPAWLQENIHAVGAYEWAVWHTGKCYPGKYILRLVFANLGLPYDYDDFYGGWANGRANDVFDELGFPVTPRPELNKKYRP